MTAFVADNDLESSPYRESKSRKKRVPEANAIYVVAASAEDKVTACLVGRQKTIENRKVGTRARPDLSRSGSALAVRRGLHKAADKPAPKPSGSNLLHGRTRLLPKCGRDRRQIGFVGGAEMLQTLPDAPRARRRLPIELFIGESVNQVPGGLVVCAKVSGEPDGPSRRECFMRGGHSENSTGLYWIINEDPGSNCPETRVPSNDTAGVGLLYFYKGVDSDSVRAQIEVEANRALGKKALQLTAIVGEGSFRAALRKLSRMGKKTHCLAGPLIVCVDAQVYVTGRS